MNAARDPTSRLRANLNPLRTSALGRPFGVGVPGSATVMSASPFSSGGSPPTAGGSSSGGGGLATPASAIQPYNPQQWVPGVAPTGVAPGSTVYEPAPPPYSPPRPRPRSVVYDAYDAMPSPPAASAAAGAPSPQPTFAPPPGTAPSARGASRERRFGLPSFGRRREEAATTDLQTIPTPIHPHPQHARHASGSHHAAAARPPPLQLAPVAAVPPPPPMVAAAAPLPPPADAPPPPGIPPASRRAASTGAIGTPTSARSRSASQVRWEPGMPLPPPPPGPPPPSGGPGSRSQSLTRGGGTTVPMLSPPTRRPPPTGVTALGPVPPTPANWVEGDSDDRAAAAEVTEAGEPTATDTAPSTPPQDTPDSSVLSESSSNGQTTSQESGGLFRAGAVRGEKTLRERRNESRTRGGGGGGAVTPAVATTPAASPRPAVHALSDILIPSPHTVGSMLQRRASRRVGGGGTPGATPTTAPAAATGTPTTAPAVMTRDRAVRQTAEQFRDGTLARLQAFAAREAAAATDADRVRLFAAFLVGESRIRRERYAAAIGAMGSDLLDLTRDLFRPMGGGAGEPGTPGLTPGLTPGATTPFATPSATPATATTTPTPTSSAPPDTPPSAPPSGGGRPLSSSNYYMPSLSPILSMSVASEHPSGKGKLRNDDDPDNDSDDELNSRGRAPSRWWEASDHGNDRTTDRGRLERSRRESKYMGVPKEQWVTDEGQGQGGGSSADYSQYGPDEYPPEKVGGSGLFSGEAASTPLAAEYLLAAAADGDPARTPQASAQNFRRSLLSSASTPGTPAVETPTGAGTPPLDVSRLVTLPPPYPRHHPAVNNAHPELAATRAAVRRLADLAAVDAVRAQFVRDQAAQAAQAAHAEQAAQAALRARLQDAVVSGAMGYAAAAAEEAALAAAAAAQRKAAVKAEFAAFQRDVVAPVHAQLTARLEEATALYDGVVARLAGATGQAADPNLPQEEGDEQPELLETLTLLKWVFDAREALHRAVYDVLTERNERYREVVLAPYRTPEGGAADPGPGAAASPAPADAGAGSSAAAKLDAASAFFAADAAARAQAEAAAAAARAAAFRAVAEDTVARGAESQLSAFWDIAPPLGELLEQIPETLPFAIIIPPPELAETPSYRAHPLQYLFGLLLHAEKSTHQFIESQTNLFCLLHEIQEVALAAAARAEGGRAVVDTEAEQALTTALQDKVRVVQEQWRSGLGDGIARVKERVGGWLLETGGWDESLEEGGVGGV